MQTSGLVLNTHEDLPFVQSPSLVPSIPTRRAEGYRPSGRPIEIYVNLRSVDRVLNDLAPFYGPSCPTSLFEVMGVVEIETMNGSLAAARQWAAQEANDRPMLLLMG